MNTSCPCCAKGTLRSFSRDYLAEIGRGQTIKVPNILREVCDQCGEEIFSLEAARAVDSAIQGYLPNQQTPANSRRKKSCQPPGPLAEVKARLEAADKQSYDVENLGTGRPHPRREKTIPPKVVAEMEALLKNAGKSLRAIMQDEGILPETPLEAQSAMESAAQSVDAALDRLASISADAAPAAMIPGGPTRQQGQFLAFIREYIMRNEAGIAPSHADLQRFFDLTAPSVNSMLIRLEQRGFIRRIPGKARAIAVVCPPEVIPPLDRPFKF